MAAGLNVILQYVSQLFKTAGIQGIYISIHPSIHLITNDLSHFLISAVGIPIQEVTPQGLIFFTQWVLVALIAYWILSLAFRLVTSTLRQALWLLKVFAALASFGYILSDRGVATETMAIRIGVLVLVCLLLGVGTSRGTNVSEKTSELENQVRILESRLREMERWRWKDE